MGTRSGAAWGPLAPDRPPGTVWSVGVPGAGRSGAVGGSGGGSSKAQSVLVGGPVRAHFDPLPCRAVFSIVVRMDVPSCVDAPGSFASVVQLSSEADRREHLYGSSDQQ